MLRFEGGGTNFYDPTLSCTPVFPPLLENSGIVQEVFALGPVRTHLMNASDFYGFAMAELKFQF